MGTNVYPGRARINPEAPETLGICARCGNQWNLRDLQWQFQWAGLEMINLNILVCPDCYDVPSEFLRTLILPPDPPPVYNVRVPNFSLFEASSYVLTTETDLILTTENDAWIATEVQNFDG